MEEEKSTIINAIIIIVPAYFSKHERTVSERV